LKLHPPLVFFIFTKVLEKNPPKQGLKLYCIDLQKELIHGVLEKNPPKQGLKQWQWQNEKDYSHRF